MALSFGAERRKLRRLVGAFPALTSAEKKMNFPVDINRLMCETTPRQ